MNCQRLACVKGLEPHDLIGESFNAFEMGEYANLAKVYVDHCRSLPQTHTHVERRLITMWADGGFGTADYLSIKEGEAWVVDAKFGRNQVTLTAINSNATPLARLQRLRLRRTARHHSHDDCPAAAGAHRYPHHASPGSSEMGR